MSKIFYMSLQMLPEVFSNSYLVKVLTKTAIVMMARTKKNPIQRVSIPSCLAC